MSEHPIMHGSNRKVLELAVLVISMTITPYTPLADAAYDEQALAVLRALNGGAVHQQYSMVIAPDKTLADAAHGERELRVLRALNGGAMEQPLPYGRLDLHHIIEDSARRHGIDDHQLAKIIMIESAGDPCAVSSKGAKGLGQLIDPTAASLGVTDPFEPRQNLNGAAKYYAMQLAAARGNAELAAAAYNFGPRALRTPYAAWPRETRRYIHKFRNLDRQFRQDDWKRHLPRSIPATNRQTCLA